MVLPQTVVTTSSCSLLLIYRPRKDERLSWPSWLTYSGRFTHISGHPSAIGRAQDRESSLVKVQRSAADHGTNLRGVALSLTFINDFHACIKDKTRKQDMLRSKTLSDRLKLSATLIEISRPERYQFVSNCCGQRMPEFRVTSYTRRRLAYQINNRASIEQHRNKYKQCNLTVLCSIDIYIRDTRYIVFKYRDIQCV